MTPNQVIDDVKESASEWLEMCENPDAMVSGILAKKVVDLHSEVAYLQNRLRRMECLIKS